MSSHCQISIPPPGKSTLCKCSEFCGGPNGTGQWVTWNQKSRHAKKEEERRTLATTFKGIPSNPNFTGFTSFNPVSTGQAPSSKSPIIHHSAVTVVDGLCSEGGSSNLCFDKDNSMPETQFVMPEDRPSFDVPIDDAVGNSTTNLAPDPVLDSTHVESPSTEHIIEEDADPPDRGNLDEIEQENDPLFDLRQPAPCQIETDYTPPPPVESNVKEIQTANQFIAMLSEASLNGPEADIEPLPDDFIHRLRNPPATSLLIDNSDERLSIEVFLAVSNASEKTYNDVRKSILKCYPDSGMLSYHQVKKRIADLSGVSPVCRDMCINSCMAFTGPFHNLQACEYCHQLRYGSDNKPRRQFTWIPLGPQLQALWRNKDNAKKLHYRRQYTEQLVGELEHELEVEADETEPERSAPFRDFFDGNDYLEACLNEQIKEEDMVVVLSIDGAQLYRNKASDCWIYIWIIYDYAPELWYKKKHVLPGGFIGGPNKLKHVDSFIFSALYHLSALQKEGLKIWDAYLNVATVINPFFALACADGPCMASLSGCVGHHGKVHCRYYCPLKGRHKPGAPMYYPVRFKPSNYNVQGCDHPDVDLSTLLKSFTPEECVRRYNDNLKLVSASRNRTEYERNRLETGISKPSIFSGLDKAHSIPVPRCFPGDIMHLPCLNIPDLMISLWRGTMDCDTKGGDDRKLWHWATLKGQVWKEHGRSVALCTPYIPGSFDRPPRNPAEKINSGYKAWEFLIYFFGLGPCLFYGVLPDDVWRHYCKLVRGIRLMMQEEIAIQELKEASQLLMEFSNEFEDLYVRRCPDRIHFVRPSIHSISHIPSKTARLGPFIIFSQWVIERTIGNLGEEVKNHSSPYANLEQRGVRRCQVNVLKALIPNLEPPENTLPRGAIDIGDGFILLRAKDRTARVLTEKEYGAWRTYWGQQAGVLQTDLTSWCKVVRWAKLRLPNGQTACSRWKEEKKHLNHIRTSRHVKFLLNGAVHIGEVHFYFADCVAGHSRYLAIVSLFGAPHSGLLAASNQTYITMEHFRDIDVHVIEAKSIHSVVIMAPDPRYKHSFQDGTETNRWFMSEKPGLKIAALQGYNEIENEVLEQEEID